MGRKSVVESTVRDGADCMYVGDWFESCSDENQCVANMKAPQTLFDFPSNRRILFDASPLADALA